ncbi:hypothetical protein DL98DRAFT_527771 [Cadophora sp. DSE1049]|nr:hypothetical protein DL98DRAFT_527771 [Cadophora sp. DSE1049]
MAQWRSKQRRQRTNDWEEKGGQKTPRGRRDGQQTTRSYHRTSWLPLGKCQLAIGITNRQLGPISRSLRSNKNNENSTHGSQRPRGNRRTLRSWNQDIEGFGWVNASYFSGQQLIITAHARRAIFTLTTFEIYLLVAAQIAESVETSSDHEGLCNIPLLALPKSISAEQKETHRRHGGAQT